MKLGPLVGSELDGYAIISLLGRGGMGVVYEAVDDLGRPVALKVMLPELIRNEEFTERFIRESQASIDHPNIIPIYEASRDGDALYIAMKLVQGPDLKSLIQKEGRLLPARTARICSQAAAALDAAHEGGLVHRDVKPQNILVEEVGADGGGEHVYLTDFGLVKRVASQSSFTDSTYLIGSVQYMAPEQIEGKEVDGRSDVYALGCVLYECLTGSVPFEKETEVAVLFAHLNEEPPSVIQKVPVLGESVDRVIAKAMAKSPDDRYLTAGEFASALSKELGVSSGRARSIWAPGVMGTSGKRKRPGGTKRHAPAPTSARPLSWRSWVAAAAAAALFVGAWVAPDGDPNKDALYPAGRDFSTESQLPHPDLMQGRVSRRTAPRHGRREGSIERGRNPAHRDGIATWITAAASASRGATGANTAAVTQTQGLPAPEGLSDVPQAVGHQGWLSVTRDSQTGGCCPDIWVMQPDRKRLTNITNHSSWDVTSAISPNGKTLVFFSQRYWRYDLYAMKLGARSAYRLTPDYAYDLNPSWAPRGSEVVYEAHPERSWNPYTDQWQLGPGLVRIVDDEGKKVRTLGRGVSPSWSPRGQRIAFVRDGDIYTMKPDGSGVARLTHTAAAEADPEWSPNGRQIVFAAGTPGDLFVIDADGSNQRRLTDTPTSADASPDWSPAGELIAWISHDTISDRRDVWIMKRDGTSRRNVTNDAINDYALDWAGRR